ncbi:MAG: VacJ family lipoprotein [Desulfovibrio sp.]|nr:VacJ family lipoprotein [Desulfovibrio sp.]
MAILRSLCLCALIALCAPSQLVAAENLSRQALHDKVSASMLSQSFWGASGEVPGAFIVVPKGAQGMSSGDMPDELDDYDEVQSSEIYDPFEGWNRFWFRFNDRFFVAVADPLYRGWQAITPPQVRWGLSNFFHNILFPVRFVNALLQGKFRAAGVEFSRFMMDTMVSAGFSNPSKYKKPLVPVDPAGEDFGQTLGVWGIGSGPYLVWPFIGPSTLRDTVGRIGDMFCEPFFYIDPWWLATSSSVFLRFNTLDTVLPLYKDLKGAALDPYLSMRQAYITYRRQHVRQ